jgi:3D (Asp-Asp-Asp) domain-containing protein/LysM repeat protein
MASLVLSVLAFSAAYATAFAEQYQTSEYVVHPGDTLSGIAARFGIDVDTIVQANRLGSADQILPGQTLTILPVSGLEYTVVPGDSLLSIAERYDAEVGAILRWNEIADPDHIVIGKDLMIPGGRVASAAPAPAPRSQPAASPPPAPAPVAAQAAPVEAGTGSTFIGKITAYSYQAPIGSGRGATTRSGTPVRWGVLAVDPQVVPLGSKVKIEGFDDVFVAEDTGGAIRGNHVEIFFTDNAAALRFGIQTRRVTILS